MTTNRKYQNISIQPNPLPRSANTIVELPGENLVGDELVRKSTSDRTKRRVAHEAWFPLPVTRKPISPVGVVAQDKPEKKHVLKKESYPGTKSCKVRTIETVAVGSTAIHKSTNYEVYDRVQDKKRKSKNLEHKEVMKKKIKVDKSKKKNVKQE